MQVERIQQAIQAGEVLRVRYFGGSRPGVERPLRPIAMVDGKLQAFCLQSGETRMLALEKLEEVAGGQTEPDWMQMIEQRRVGGRDR